MTAINSYHAMPYSIRSYTLHCRTISETIKSPVVPDGDNVSYVGMPAWAQGYNTYVSKPSLLRLTLGLHERWPLSPEVSGIRLKGAGCINMQWVFCR